MNDQALTDVNYNDLGPRLRPITDEPIQLRRPRVIDDVDPDELDGYTVIELDDDTVDNEPDGWVDEDELDLAYQTFLEDFDKLANEAA